jgi:UDP-3-O-[3-hydroxymyristoyl] glucosamine N-acyltransferase
LILLRKEILLYVISSKYLTLLDKTKASACIINKNFLKRVPSNCIPLVSENPHIDFIKVSNLFYGDFVIDKISKKYLKSNQIKKNLKKFLLVIILYVKMVLKLEKM